MILINKTPAAIAMDGIAVSLLKRAAPHPIPSLIYSSEQIVILFVKTTLP